MTNSLFIKTILVALALAVSPIAASDSAAGTNFDLSEHQGNVIVVDFWASWCVPCRRSFPWLNAMSEKYADEGLIVIGVNVDQDAESAAEFLQKYPARFRIEYDQGGNLAREFGVQAMPSSFVIGRDGQIRAHHLGFKVKRQNEYETAIVEALRQEIVE